MNPELLLVVVAAFAAFLLKTTFAFGLCTVFDWLVDSPNRRFMIWLSFLCGASGYWIWLAKDVLTAGQFSPGSFFGPARPAVSSFGTWQIPDSWSYPMGVALRVIGISYLLVLSYMLFAHVRKQRKLRWILGFTTEPPIEIAESFRLLAQSLHLGRARLLVLSGVTSPATFGWIRPTILLPDLCLSHDHAELEDILRHELHHIHRKDFVWNALAMVSRSLIFFHPAAWYATRKLHFDRELACDLAVVSHSPTRRATYAECLVRFARLNLEPRSHTWEIDFAASSQHLKARVHSILAGAKIAPKWLICLRAAAGVTLLAGFIGIIPSLAVLLSYGHRQISQPSTADVPAPQTIIKSRPGTRPKSRLHATSAPANSDPAAAPIGQGEGLPPGNSALADEETQHSSKALSSAGPQLLHRSAGASSGPPKQETIELIDPGGPDSKTADQTVKQALQQSLATAAAIYKQTSDAGRH
jgi:beta-lactamase regulating signal transducer with metallopeptidase domain